MAPISSQVEHPYVTRSPDLARGAPVITGTKFPVRSVVQYILRQGYTAEELIEDFPQLSLPKIYDALSYYYDHREEMDKEMSENTESSWRGAVEGKHGPNSSLLTAGSRPRTSIRNFSVTHGEVSAEES